MAAGVRRSARLANAPSPAAPAAAPVAGKRRAGSAAAAPAAVAGGGAAKKPRGGGPTRDKEKAAWAKGLARVAGVDEAGRGPLAGPVVAAAAVLDPAVALDGALAALNDSKQVPEDEREQLYEALKRAPGVEVASCVVGPETIDSINILQVSLIYNMFPTSNAHTDVGRREGSLR